MKIKSNSEVDQMIITDKKKCTGVILKPGDNTVSKENYELMKKDNWFNWLLQVDLISIQGVKTKKVAEIIKEESPQTIIKIEKE